MTFEELKKLPREQMQAELRRMTLKERLAFTEHVVAQLGTIVASTFPEAHAIVTEGQLRSDRASAEIAQSEIERIRRM